MIDFWDTDHLISYVVGAHVGLQRQAAFDARLEAQPVAAPPVARSRPLLTAYIAALELAVAGLDKLEHLLMRLERRLHG